MEAFQKDSVDRKQEETGTLANSFAQDPEHPGAEVRPFVKGSEAFQGFGKSLLHQVPRLIRVTAKPTGEVI